MIDPLLRVGLRVMYSMHKQQKNIAGWTKCIKPFQRMLPCFRERKSHMRMTTCSLRVHHMWKQTVRPRMHVTGECRWIPNPGTMTGNGWMRRCFASPLTDESVARKSRNAPDGYSNVSSVVQYCTQTVRCPKRNARSPIGNQSQHYRRRRCRCRADDEFMSGRGAKDIGSFASVGGMEREGEKRRGEERREKGCLSGSKGTKSRGWFFSASLAP